MRAGEAGALAVGYAGAHVVKGTRIMVYALGQWCVAAAAAAAFSRLGI